MESNNSILVKTLIFFSLFSILYAGITFAESDLVPDTENCLLCHRYPHMGRYDEAGKKRVLYVNDKLFAESVHGNLRCKDCHVGLDKIPHTDVKEVDCASKCHIDEPSTKKEFSHTKVLEIHEASAHGARSGQRQKSYIEDLPTCKYCHNNRVLNPAGDMWSIGEAVSTEAMGRCFGCHLNKEWGKRFYSHVTHRMKRRRSQVEIVELCLSCHEDRQMMERRGLRTVETFRDTFHWVQIKYGVQNAPDCLSCHVPIGYAKHDILVTADPRSPVNPANRVNTCRHQGGVQICHPDADAKFVAGREHAFGMTGAVVSPSGGKLVDWATKSKVIMSKRRAELGISKHAPIYDMILDLVKIFYKILIASVVGSMLIHQLLDFVRTRKERKTSH